MADNSPVDDFPPLPPPLQRESTMWQGRPFQPKVCPRADDWEAKEPAGAPTDDETPDCQCGKRSAVHVIKKDTSPHKGKYFFSCAKRKEDPTVCGFWQLQGGPIWKPMQMAPTHVTCDCRKQARAVVQKKAGKNQGRAFYTCAKKECGWFRWA